VRVSARYEELLRSRGVSLAEMGVRDIGLVRNDALLAIEFLREAEIPILGGDVWFCRDGKLDVAYANWHTDPNPMEDPLVYSQRSCNASEQYVRDFPEQVDVEPLFVLVIGR